MSFKEQEELEYLSNQLMERFDDLVEYFGLDITNDNSTYKGCCPIHQGDNPSAFNIYQDKESNWRWECYTYECQETFFNDLIGFVRGLLSRNQGWTQHSDDTVSMEQAIDFVVEFLGSPDIKNIKTDDQSLEKRQFVKLIDRVHTPIKNEKEGKDGQNGHIHRSQICKSLTIPAQYYINRRYSKEILTKYDVGCCNDQTKPMANRVVVPIYDSSGDKMEGCAGRSVFDQCEECKMYHPTKMECPNKSEFSKYGKWKFSYGFKSSHHLYNYWFAKSHIEDSQTAILVESPGNVWRLEEAGIHNSLCIFGIALKGFQELMLSTMNIFNIILILDNDKDSTKNAGQIAQEKITEQLRKIYRVFTIVPEALDIGEMTVDEVKSEILPQIQKIQLTNSLNLI